MGSTARIGFIDGCRALAVLGVVLDHCAVHSAWAQRIVALAPSADPTRWAMRLIAQGAHGVDLFFVISGFCLAYPTIASCRRDGRVIFSPEHFFAKRLMRIVPPYYIALLLCLCALAVLGMLHFPIPTAMAHSPGIGDIIGQLLFFDRRTHLANDSFWTLFVEFRWYICFPFLLALWFHSKRAYCVFWVLLVAAYHLTRARSIDMGVLPEFMLGIVAADWQVVGHPLRRYAPLLAFLAFDLALTIEPFASVPGINGREDYGSYTQANIGWHLTCFFFVVAAGSWTPLRMLLQIRPLALIGLTSYSIYLVHQPIVSFIEENLTNDLGEAGAFLVAGVVSVSAGIVFWWAAERWFCHGCAVYTYGVSRIENILHGFFSSMNIPKELQFTAEASKLRALRPGP